MLQKNYIYFDRGYDEVADSPYFTMGGTKNIDRNCTRPKSWEFLNPSRLYLHFSAKPNKDYNLALAFTTKDTNGLIVDIGINEETLWTYENLKIVNSVIVFSINCEELKFGENTISIDVRYSDNSHLYLSYAMIEEVYYDDLPSVTTEKLKCDYKSQNINQVKNSIHDRPDSNKYWMKGIYDDTPLSGISIPGTHDSASINRVFHSFWSCQDRSIKKQLLGGIRLLDIRIRVVGTKPEDLKTCHGKGKIGEYENLYKVFDAVTDFLKQYSTECVVMTLKVDDWADYDSDHLKGKQLILKFLDRYKDFIYISSVCPTLDKVRSKIYLINRIDNTMDFGVPISIPDNTKGFLLSETNNRKFNVYVQDYYDFNKSPFTANSQKYEVVRKMLDYRTLKYNDNPETRKDMYLCYCNGFRLGFGVYIMKDIIDYFGAELPLYGRPFLSPWMFFDYPFMAYQTNNYGFMNVVEAVIDLNYAVFHHSYSKKYKCVIPNDIYEL